MVIGGEWIALAAPFAQQGAKKLPPPQQAMVLMALLGILLVGMFLIVAVLLGGHWVRRLGKHRRGPAVPPDRAPLVKNFPPARDVRETVAEGETIGDANGSSPTVERRQRE